MKWIEIRTPMGINIKNCKVCGELLFQQLDHQLQVVNERCYINPKTKEIAHISCILQLEENE